MKTQILVFLALFSILTVAQEYDPELSRNFLYYAKNAYCEKNVIENWTCASCFYNSGATDAKVFKDLVNGTFGYTAYNPNQNLIIVAFRGSENIQNWIDNIDYKKEDYPQCAGCQVHKGFYRAWNSLATDCLDNVKDLKTKYPNAKVLVTGHSLGGAISELATLDIFQNGITVDYLYSYGTPRIGNTELAQYAHEKIPGAMRVVHYKDPVPHVPTQSMGFLQVPTEVWYNSKKDVAQYKVCIMPGVEEDPKCSDSKLDINISDHLHYLGISTSCNSGEEQQQYQSIEDQVKEMQLNMELSNIIKQDMEYMRIQQNSEDFI